MKIEFAGRGLVMSTPEAVAGPWLVTDRVKVTLFPMTTGSGVSEMPIVRSIEPLSTQQEGSIVVTLRVHPPPILPEKLAVSSRMSSCHTPLGLVPLNTDKSAT